MTIEAVIYARLSGFAGLAALVSTRIYPNVVPNQNVDLPYVAWRRVSAARLSAHGSDIGIVSSRFQFDSFHSDYSVMRAVVAQVRAALQRWRDAATNPAVLDTFLENDLDLFDDNALLHHGMLDAMIHYRE